MDEKTKLELLQSVRETAGILAEARNSAEIDESRARVGRVLADYRGRSLAGAEDQASRRVALALDPCRLFAGVLVNEADAEEVGRGMRMCAARIRAGDTSFIYEALTAQVVVLQNIAAQALEKVGTHGGSAVTRATTLGVAIKAQALASKIMFSLLAMEGAR